MKKLYIICIILLNCCIANAQNSIKGKVTDQDNVPLAGATIYVPDLNKGTIADSNGSFELLNLPYGKFQVQFSFIGYENQVKTIDPSQENSGLSVSLKQSVIEAEEIIVSAGYSSTQHDNAVKIDVLKLKPGEIKVAPAFMEVLTRVPGVDMISKGSGVTKPVIRGLSMNDILVLNNGVRFENYQYSSHHPLGIDEFGIENVEVIKGPASLLYGSDAIGGVINFIKEKPAPVGTVSGDYNMQLFSNTLGLVNNFGIKGASKKMFWGMRIGQKSHADFKQGGGDYVPNSRFNELSLKTNAGFTGKAGTFKLFYDYNNEKLGLVEDEAIEAISERGRKNGIWYQELNTHLLSSQNKLYFGRLKLDINSAYQNTELIHFGEADIVEIQMRLGTFTYNASLHLPSKENSEYIIGVQGYNQKNLNVNERETKLLPDAVTNNYSAFGLFQYTFFKKLKLQTGVRYDIKTISTDAIGPDTDASDYRAAVDKNFGSFSGSLGATYSFSDKLIARVNVASAYRTPNLAELTSNGQHELRYEIGANDLVPEKSVESDMSLHYHINNLTFDIAGFYNCINNYIFISPTGDTTSTGICIYKYRQANSSLFGGEAGLHFHPRACEWLHFETKYSMVIGKQKNGDYLPFVPAHKFDIEMRAEKEKLLFMTGTFISVNTNTAFKQDNPAPDETATSGYTLLDMSAGGNIKIINQEMSIVISVNNISDKKYIDHLSTLKEVGLYNQGRNISLSIKIPFGIRSDNK